MNLSDPIAPGTAVEIGSGRHKTRQGVTLQKPDESGLYYVLLPRSPGRAAATLQFTRAQLRPTPCAQ